MKFEDLLEREAFEWPRNARDLILGAIDDAKRDPRQREKAIHMAGDLVVMDDIVADRLMHLLRDESFSPEMRAAAAIALGPVLESGDTMGFDDPDDVEVSKRTFESIRQTLRLVYEDPKAPKLVARKCLEAAIRAPAKWQLDEVRKRIASDDVEWKTTAVFAMGQVEGFEKEILASLDDARIEVRYEAVRAAGEIGLRSAWKPIEKLLDEKTPRELLIAAILATASVNPAEAPAALAPFTASKDTEIREIAQYALEESGLHSLMSDDDDE